MFPMTVSLSRCTQQVPAVKTRLRYLPLAYGAVFVRSSHLHGAVFVKVFVKVITPTIYYTNCTAQVKASRWPSWSSRGLAIR